MFLTLAMTVLVAPSANAATWLDGSGAAACEATGTREMNQLRLGLWRAQVELPLRAVSMLVHDDGGQVVQRSYWPLGVALLDRVDPRVARTFSRVGRATSLQTAPVDGERQLLVVLEHQRRVVDFALVEFGDLEPGRLRIGLVPSGASGQVRRVEMCVVEISAWSSGEYMPKAR